MRKIKLFALPLLLVLVSIMFVGCGNKSNELETRIRNDYVTYLHSQGDTDVVLADVQILKIYGNFDGVVVVRFDRPAFEVVTTVQVGGVDLVFDNSNVAIVWQNGNFFDLQMAYENGLLSIANLNAVAEKVN
ncbi:MAG: hypothetical protein LBG88_02530 [Christensenellaceae bacterium]|jgi:hypothetical protein|nr:hypothetical protein [Christensenellaceae bacterium]